MALQTARPASDITTTGWAPVPASPATFFDKIDESSPSAADYVESGLAPDGSEPIEIKFQALVDPLTGNVTLEYMISKNAAGGAQIDADMEIIEGATVISTWTHTNVSATPVAFIRTIAESEFSNFANLRIRATPVQV